MPSVFEKVQAKPKFDDCSDDVIAAAVEDSRGSFGIACRELRKRPKTAPEEVNWDAVDINMLDCLNLKKHLAHLGLSEKFAQESSGAPRGVQNLLEVHSIFMEVDNDLKRLEQSGEYAMLLDCKKIARDLQNEKKQEELRAREQRKAEEAAQWRADRADEAAAIARRCNQWRLDPEYYRCGDPNFRYN